VVVEMIVVLILALSALLALLGKAEAAGLLLASSSFVLLALSVYYGLQSLSHLAKDLSQPVIIKK